MISAIFGASGFVGIVYYIIFHSSEEFKGFYNQSAFVLLAFAPISVILLSRSFTDLFAALKIIITMNFLNQQKEMMSIANAMTTMSQAIRNEGIGVLATYRDKVKNPLFKDGIALIVNGFTEEEIKHNLMAKVNAKQTLFSQAVSVFDSLGKLAPAMGLLGTLVGLVQMLSNLSDPSKIGPGMAVSLLATLYGLILGNAVFIPLGEKIDVHAEKVQQLDIMILEGVLLLKEKKSNAHFREVVNTYAQKAPPVKEAS